MNAAKQIRPHARVLLIQHLDCACGTSYSFPLEHVLYRYNLTPNTSHLKAEGTPYFGIPSQLEHLHHTAISSCPACFKTFEPADQLELFPELICPPPALPRWRKPPAEPATSETSKHVLQLSDF